PTANSNAAFGYNFEGGLQEYCIVDERVAIDSNGDRFLIPVKEEKSASAVALVEPWACVENSYVNRERQGVKAKGRLLIVAESALPADKFPALPVEGGGNVGTVKNIAAADAANMPNEGFDDIVYFGSDRKTIEI